jgi:hypothetical protein
VGNNFRKIQSSLYYFEHNNACTSHGEFRKVVEVGIGKERKEQFIVSKERLKRGPVGGLTYQVPPIFE